MDARVGAEMAAAQLDGLSAWRLLARLWREEEARLGVLRSKGHACVSHVSDPLRGDVNAQSDGGAAGARGEGLPASWRSDSDGVDEEGDAIEPVMRVAPLDGAGGGDGDEAIAIKTLLRGETAHGVALRGLGRAPTSDPSSRALARAAAGVDNRAGIHALAIALRAAIGAQGTPLHELARAAAAVSAGGGDAGRGGGGGGSLDDDCVVLLAIEAFEQFAVLREWSQIGRQLVRARIAAPRQPARACHATDERCERRPSRGEDRMRSLRRLPAFQPAARCGIMPCHLSERARRRAASRVQRRHSRARAHQPARSTPLLPPRHPCRRAGGRRCPADHRRPDSSRPCARSGRGGRRGRTRRAGRVVRALGRGARGHRLVAGALHLGAERRDAHAGAPRRSREPRRCARLAHAKLPRPACASALTARRARRAHASRCCPRAPPQPPRQRTYTQTMHTRERVDGMVRDSFKGYGGSLASLNHTIGITGYPFGGGSLALSADAAEDNARRSEMDDDQLSDDDDGTDGPRAPELLVTAAPPMIETIEFARSARLSASGRAAGAHALGVPSADGRTVRKSV